MKNMRSVGSIPMHFRCRLGHLTPREAIEDQNKKWLFNRLEIRRTRSVTSMWTLVQNQIRIAVGRQIVAAQ